MRPVCPAAIALLVGLLCGCSDSSDDAVIGSSPVPSPTASAPTATPADTPSPTPGKVVVPSGRPTSTPPVTGRHAALGANFTLAEGESMRVDGTDLVVTFTRVVEDSRCPTSVTCIRAGEARIVVTVRGAGAPVALQLDSPAATSAGAPTNEKRVGPYLVRLESVDPYPAQPASGTAKPALTATLRVTRAKG
jgi:hypothetical protein